MTAKAQTKKETREKWLEAITIESTLYRRTKQNGVEKEDVKPLKSRNNTIVSRYGAVSFQKQPLSLPHAIAAATF